MSLRAKLVPQMGIEAVDGDSPTGGIELVEGVRPESLFGVVPIGPIKISLLSAEQLTQRLIGHAFGDVTQHVVTANAQFYVLAEERQDFRDCIRGADYVCADGVSIVVACKWLGRAKATRIPGVDLVSDLCRNAAGLALKVFFVGGNPGSAERSAAILMERFPGLRVAGICCPPKGFQSDPEMLSRVLSEIKESQPAILFVALGAPFQEFFIQDYIRPMNIPVAVGIGGSLDIIAGEFKRAPRYIQRLGLEWAFRLAQEPRRLARRYIVGNSLFLFYLVRYLLGYEAPTGRAD
ncbi:MAG TPA: WecB/TagA/CpsF family glycosyltransferase [Edaphobacter sp.]|nr:WecB/TagA/CpsF family glycosyltransferase [Edaphobacter sp.]